MALVRIFSDLHLEFGLAPIQKCVDICSKNRTKYIILAGDITNFEQMEDNLTKLVSVLKPLTDRIIYILGNHEYYKIGQINTCYVLDMYRDLSKKLDIDFLENQYLETEDFIFYGTTLWSDVSVEAFYGMSDKFSFKSRQEILDLYNNSTKKLETFINEYKSDKALVVITHHMPSFELIDEKYKIFSDINSGFASNLDHLIRYPVSRWVYGHTHKPSYKKINDVEMFCNPHGYPGRESMNFKDCIF